MKTWFLRLQPLFLLLATGWIIWLLFDQWEALRTYPWRLQWPWLLVATALMLVSWALEVRIWRRLLQLLGGRLPYWAAVRIWFLSAIVRYIPGNIWQPLSMTLHCQGWGIRPEATITSVLFFQIITLLAAAPITALYLWVQPLRGPMPAFLADWPVWFSGLLLLPIVVLLVIPRWLFAIINWGLGKISRPALTMQITSGQLSGLLLLAMLHWLCWGAAFAALTFALSDFSGAVLVQLTPHLIALYGVAYAVGFLSLITPSGLGVREGALYLLLTPFLNAGLVTAAALAMRGWTTLGEIVLAGLSVLAERQQARVRDRPDFATAPETTTPSLTLPADGEGI